MRVPDRRGGAPAARARPAVLSPGALRRRARDGLERSRALAAHRTSSCSPSRARPAWPAGHLGPAAAVGRAPFLIYFGEGAPYALVAEPAERDGRVTLFHSCDRVLVESLAVRLQRELGVPRRGEMSERS